MNHTTVGGFREYTYGPGGHLEFVDASGNTIDLKSDEAGLLSTLDRAFGDIAGMSYDGRSFLGAVEVPEGGADPATTQATYSSPGLLMSLELQESAASSPEVFGYLSFAGRPVGQVKTVAGGNVLTYLHADHLGTPFVASDAAGEAIWVGPFEPFGRDWQEASRPEPQRMRSFCGFLGSGIRQGGVASGHAGIALSLPRRHHGLGEPQGARLAAPSACRWRAHQLTPRGAEPAACETCHFTESILRPFTTTLSSGLFVSSKKTNLLCSTPSGASSAERGAGKTAVVAVSSGLARNDQAS